MRFTHFGDPARTATIEVLSSEPAIVEVSHTDGKGKLRKKTFKNAMLYRAHDAALRFLLNKERYVIRSPQPGAVQWMTRLMQDYRGGIGHAVDPISGAVWIADAIDHGHRITPGTVETREVALGSGNTSPGCLAAAGTDGRGYLLCLSWEKRDAGLVRSARLIMLRPEGDSLAVHELAKVVSPNALTSLHSDEHGRVLGPDPDGAALYDADGKVLARWPLEPIGENISPLGALSRNGEWVVFASGSRCARIHLPSGEQLQLASDFASRLRLQISNAGTVYLAGLLGPNYGVFALGEGEPRRVSTSLSAEVSADGDLLVETEHNTVTLRDLRQANSPETLVPPITRHGRFPVLGMAKTGQALFGRPGELVVLTDAYTVAGLDIAAIPTPD